MSSAAATIIALACGTNYVYSAWAPQFAERLKLSSTESNLLGLAANFGMYTMGIPIGIFVDARGPRPAVLAGTVLLAAGYFSLRRAYITGEGSLFMLCVSAFCTGLGGCSGFAAAIKTSALNWPHHRGTATAFPLAGFGLSAFFFSIFSQFIFSGDTDDFLLLLAAGTSGMTFLSFFFLRVHPHLAHTDLLGNDALARANSNPLRRTRSEERKCLGGREVVQPDFVTFAPRDMADSTETSSLMSKTSSSPGDIDEDESNVDKDHFHRIDIRGFQMLYTPEFWFQFALMGILTGIGLMTINNIGNNVTALWRHYDDSVSPGFVVKRQAMHVSILSICSFAGRILSGIGSDFLVKGLEASRSWSFVIASLVFFAAQVAAISIEVPTYLWIVSSLTGLAYGFVFGVFPSIVAETFGVHGLSQNWGCMTLAPVVSGNIFMMLYGLVYDGHTKILPNGQRLCDDGVQCYRSAYGVTCAGCVLGLAISLWSIHHRHARKMSESRGRVGSHAA